MVLRSHDQIPALGFPVFVEKNHATSKKIKIKIVLVLLSALVKRFFVSRVLDFFLEKVVYDVKSCLSTEKG